MILKGRSDDNYEKDSLARRFVVESPFQAKTPHLLSSMAFVAKLGMALESGQSLFGDIYNGGECSRVPHCQICQDLAIQVDVRLF